MTEPLPDTPLSFFISYSHHDEAAAASLELELRRRGARVWRDKTALAIGDSLSQRIPDAIVETDFAIVLVSEHYLTSTWATYEMRIAVARGLEQGVVRVLPVRLGELPDYRLPAALSDLVWLRLTEGAVGDASAQLLAAAGVHRDRRLEMPQSVEDRRVLVLNLVDHETVGDFYLKELDLRIRLRADSRLPLFEGGGVTDEGTVRATIALSHDSVRALPRHAARQSIMKALFGYFGIRDLESYPGLPKGPYYWIDEAVYNEIDRIGDL